MFKVLWKLVFIQFKTFYRQPDTLFWAIVFPIALFLILGFAFDPKKESISQIGLVQNIQAQDNETTVLVTLAKNIQIADKKLKISVQKYQSEAEAVQDLKRGKISLFIKFSPNSMEYYFDPQNTQAQNVYLLLENLLKPPANIETKVIPLKAKGTRYIDFFLPGLLGFNIMSACLWGIGWNLIEVRMKKYLKRLTATPMSRNIFLLSQILARLIISTFEMSFIIIVAYLTFGVTIQGNIWALIYLLILGVFAFSGFAVLIGSRTASSMTGNGLINAFIMPMMLTSGIFFSYHNFPKVVIPFIKYLPLTIFADSVRAIFNEGAGFSIIMMPSAILLIFGLVSFGIGIKIFKWF